MYSVLINKQMQACHINNTLVYTTLLYMTRIKHCVPIQVTSGSGGLVGGSGGLVVA